MESILLRSFFFSSLIALFVANAGFAENLCPAFPPPNTDEHNLIDHPAVACRSSCKKNSDCVGVKDACNIPYYISKSKLEEFKIFLKDRSRIYCHSELDEDQNLDSLCFKNACKPKVLSCKAQITGYEKYLSSAFDQKCTRDEDCVWIAEETETCPVPRSVSKSDSLTKESLRLGLEGRKVQQACIETRPKTCPPPKRPALKCLNQKCKTQFRLD